MSSNQPERPDGEDAPDESDRPDGESDPRQEFSPSINVTPEQAMYDETVEITAEELEPGKEATVRAQMPLPNGVWESSAVFEVRYDGTLDLTEQEPVRGDYEGVDPMGLFWSMSHETAEQRATREDDVDATVAVLSVEMYGQTLDQTKLERTISTDDVERTRLEHDELVGEFYRPGDDGPYPTIILVGGSEGGLAPWMPARLLASQGYAVLGLAYFGIEDLPPSLDRISLSYFRTALDWIAENDLTRSSPVGIVGWSRGAELGLLLGSEFAEITTVVGYAPSGVVFQGVPNGFESVESAWSKDGESVPYIEYEFGLRFQFTIFVRYLLRRSLGLRPTYENGFEKADPDDLEAATIPVENVGGPILLVSGDDDQMWNADALADHAIERLETHEYDHEYEHVCYEDAGHGFGVPNHPTMERSEGSDFFPGLPIDLGGSPKAQAEADADAWERVLDTLEQGLRGETDET